MEVSNNHIAEDNTLYQMLEGEIVMPDYQRDYAQGRFADAKIKETSSKFIDDIIESICSDRITHMGLVYGSHNNELDGFVAVDGQQRLTTAFLFHLYVNKHAKVEDKELDKRLHNFGWHGRPYASEFTGFILNSAIWSNGANSLSERFSFQRGYFKVWELDPTVNNMRVILDTIDAKLKNKVPKEFSSMIDALKSAKCRLRFDSMRLAPDTDEFQYQKMNSRGRELSTYELFKQKLQDNVCLSESFKTKMDNAWLQFFDKNAVAIEGNCEADIYYQNFINEVSLIFGIRKDKDFCYVDSFTDSKTNRDKGISDVKFVTFDAYTALRHCPNLFERLTDWFINNFAEVSSILKSFEFVEYRSDWSSILSHEVSWHLRAVFYAVISYAWKTSRFSGKLNKDLFSLWWRPVYNLIAGTDIWKENFYRIMQSIDALPIEGIYEFICDNEILRTFSEYQWSEEKRKSKFCISNPNLIKEFSIQERRRRFQGQIGVLLPDNEESLEVNRWYEITKRFGEMIDGKYDKTGTADFEFVSTMFSFIRADEDCYPLNGTPLKYRQNHLKGGRIPARWIHKMLFDFISRKSCDEALTVENYFVKRRKEWLDEYSKQSYAYQKNLAWVYYIYDNFDTVKISFDSSDNGYIKFKDGNWWLYHKANKNDEDILLSNRRQRVIEHLNCSVKPRGHDRFIKHPSYPFLNIVFLSSNIWIGIDANADLPKALPNPLPEGIESSSYLKARIWTKSEICNNYYELEGESFDIYLDRIIENLNSECNKFLYDLGLVENQKDYIAIKYYH